MSKCGLAVRVMHPRLAGPHAEARAKRYVQKVSLVMLMKSESARRGMVEYSLSQEAVDVQDQVSHDNEADEFKYSRLFMDKVVRSLTYERDKPENRYGWRGTGERFSGGETISWTCDRAGFYITGGVAGW